MKRKTAVRLIAVSCAVCMLPFAGCGRKETAQSLAASVAKNLNAAESVSLNMTMDFAAELDMGSLDESLGSVTMTMNVDLDAETTRDPSAAYLTGTTSVSAAGESQEQEVESYALEEDGEYVSYTWDGAQWYRTAAEADASGAEMMGNDIYQAIADGDLEAELDEEMAMIDSRDVYVIRSNLVGDELREMISFSMENTGMLAEDSADWDEMEAAARIYVFSDTKMPARIRMDCRDLGNMVMAASAGLTGINVNVEKFDIEINFQEFNGVDEITVPSSVKDSAVDSSGGSLTDDSDGDTEDASDETAGGISGLADNIEGWNDGTEDVDDDAGDPGLTDGNEGTPDANGNYTVYSSDAAHSAVITMVDGQEFSYGDDGYFSSMESDYSGDSVDFTYTFNEYYTLEEMAEDRADCSWMEEYEEYSNIVPGEVQEMEVNGRTVYWVANTFDFDGDMHFADYYGWTQVGNILFEIEMNNYGSDALTADESLLQEAFENVVLN